MIVFFVYYTSDSIRESEPLEGPNVTSKVIPETNRAERQYSSVARPTLGMSTWIGEDSEDFQKKFGKPSGIEPSFFGYEWWIYNKTPSQFMMAGISEGKIVQLYIAGQDLDVTPYQINQSVEDIYRSTVIEPEVSVTLGENIYTFSVNDFDMRTRMLVQFEDVYAQLYINEEQSKLQAVRFTDGKTLVLHKPYEMSFIGQLVTNISPSPEMQQMINKANERTLFEIINLFRGQKKLPLLVNNLQLSALARSHSEDMMLGNYLSHDSPKYGNLKKRLEQAGMTYASAAENIANGYYDAIEAAHGWLNSEEHRTVMLDEKFMNVGSGVVLNYYTQILTENEETTE